MAFGTTVTALSICFARYPLICSGICRLSYIRDFSSVLRLWFEGMMSACFINVLTIVRLCCEGCYESNAKCMHLFTVFIRISTHFEQTPILKAIKVLNERPASNKRPLPHPHSPKQSSVITWYEVSVLSSFFVDKK